MDWSGRASSGSRPPLSNARTNPMRGPAPFASFEDLSVASFDISSPVGEFTPTRGKCLINVTDKFNFELEDLVVLH